jgi:YD repeat-containing protein
MNRPLLYVLTVLSLLNVTSVLFADKHPNTARGFDIGKPYQMNGIDNVNLFNGNLTVTIPIGQRYHVNGGLQYGLTLVYSGNSWDVVDEAIPGRDGTIYPNRRSNAGLGWLVSLGRLFPPNQYPTQESPNWSYETPDGGLHAFHAGLHDGTFACGPANLTCYTADGSYLRMTTSGSDRTIEFPDGTKHLFREMQKSTSGAWTDTPGTGLWRLRAISDSFANTVTINYDGTAANPEIWTIIDGARTQKVYFNAGQTPQGAQTPYDTLVDRIVLTTFGFTTSEWKTAYAFLDIGRGGPIGHGTYLPPSFANVPLLTAFTLPAVNSVSQVYSMLDTAGSPDYFVAANKDVNVFNGVLKGLQLPTKGWLEWDYSEYVFSQSSDESVRRSIGVATRRMLDPSHANAQTWQYRRAESSGRTCFDPVSNSWKFGPPEQLVVSVTTPEQVTSVHYFSIYPDGAGDPCGGTPFQFIEYSLPITRGISQTVASTTTQYLSQETYTGTPPDLTTSSTNYRVTGGTRLRSEWALYEYDDAVNDINSRESVHVTQYEDDVSCTGGCYTAVSRFNFDGAGHFRQSSTRSNFAPDASPAGNYVTAFTNYNAVDLTGPWLLNRFTEQCKVEDSRARAAASSCADLAIPVSGGSILSGPHVQQFCFDTNGFLTRHRQLAAATPAANDVIAVYTATNGNVTREDYYGGDAQSSMPLTDFCVVSSFGSPAYSIAHTYSNGSLATSQYLPTATLPDPGFLTADNTIDPNTGLVSFSRDVSGLQTSYLYDALGRITSVTPPGTPPSSEVPSTFAYSESSAPFTVTAQRASSSGTIQAITEFDGLGRVAREQETLPATTTSRTTTYTGSGWIDKVSQWETNPANYTTYTYDAFGRPLTIKAPDTSLTTLQYSGAHNSGIHTTTRTVNMGTARSGTVVSQSPTVTTETYDAQGRLTNVHDGLGLDTSYAYDVSGHLTGVLMGAQTRSFTYDGRGFLTSEQHPELNGAAGTVNYGGFDARGHAGTKLIGTSLSDFDVAYSYDAAERLKQIDQITARTPRTTRPLKIFTFATTPGGGRGKLSQDLRHNYRGSDDVMVTEDYTYRDGDGKLITRKTTIDKGSTRLQQFTQSYDYTDIGDLSKLTYPTCADNTRPCGASSLSFVAPVFSKGMVTSLPGFANSITYHDDGTINLIAHPGGITDTYEADDHAMGRPKSIKFELYDTCTRPSITSVTASPTGTLPPQTTVQLTATPVAGASTPLSYQWYHVVNSVALPISGVTSAVFSEVVGATTTTYRVRIGNGCGASESDITVPVCSSLSISSQPGSITLQSPNPGTTLNVVATGCGTLSYQWYQIVNSANTPVGSNSSSFATGALTSTSTYWVKVTDSQGSVNSNNAVVTVTCTPQITEQPLSQSAIEGTPISLHVSVSGCSGRIFDWWQGPQGNKNASQYLGSGTVSNGTSTLQNTPSHTVSIWAEISGDSLVTVDSNAAIITAVPPAPTAVNAYVSYHLNQTYQITVAWQGSSYADHYKIQRCSSGGCIPFDPASNPYVDASVTAGTTYVYKVAAVDSGSGVSSFSSPDLATTMTFTPLQPGITVISFAHLTEVLTAVNAVRAAAGNLTALTWQVVHDHYVANHPSETFVLPGSNGFIYAVHIKALREEMNGALSALSLPTPSYTDALTITPPTPIKAIHFTELQGRTQ